MKNEEMVFNPEDFQKRIEADDFDSSNLTEEDKEKLAKMRFFVNSEKGITSTFIPFE